MKNEIDSKYYIFMAVLCALFFACGYKVGDSSGYKDGYEVGYRYDCKEEIGDLYKRVKNQSQALKYTDSVIKVVYHLNDSLMRKEYYQKRYDDSIRFWNQYSVDSIKYHVLARKYGDSVSKSIGSYPSNFILPNGKINTVMCFFAPGYKDLRECQNGFDIREIFDSMLNKQKISRKGNK